MARKKNSKKCGRKKAHYGKSPQSSEPSIAAAVTNLKLNTSCPLLDLPNELLIPILGMAVTVSTQEDPIRIDKAVKSKKSTSVNERETTQYRKGAMTLLQPAITRTCRFLRREGLPLFYENNTFAINQNRHSYRAAARWLKGSLEERIQQISRIWLLCDSDPRSYGCGCAFVGNIDIGDDYGTLIDLQDATSCTVSVRVEGEVEVIVLGRIKGRVVCQISFSGDGLKEDGEEWREVAVLPCYHTVEWEEDRDFAVLKLQSGERELTDIEV